MDKLTPWLKSEVYDSDLAAGDDAAVEPEAEAEADDENTFWDSMIFPI